jgi:hypothetical protein
VGVADGSLGRGCVAGVAREARSFAALGDRGLGHEPRLAKVAPRDGIRQHSPGRRFPQTAWRGADWRGGTQPNAKEPGSMSHIVIHDDKNSVTHYRQFDTVQAAASYVEQLHNGDGITDAKLFALHEVEYVVKSYVKIEVGAPAPAAMAPAPEPAPVREAPPARAAAPTRDEVVAAPVAPTAPIEEIDTVEYVEAAMVPEQPVGRETFAPGPLSELTDEALATGEARRGLFGR